MKDLVGLNVLITGGCGHIGRALSKSFLQSGCNVFVLGTDKNKFDSIFEEDNKITFLKHDFRKESEEKLKLKIEGTCKRVDVLVNNAYYGSPKAPLENTVEEFMMGIEGTVGIYYSTVKNCLPSMPDGSKIINIGSMYGSIVPDFSMYDSLEKINPLSYGVGKSGVDHMTKYLSNFLANRNITVNCVLPGAMPNEETCKDVDFIKRIAQRTPLRRLGKPADLSGIVLLLSSPGGDFITGQSIFVDGGFSNLK